MTTPSDTKQRPSAQASRNTTPNLWHRLVDWFGASAIGSWIYSRLGPPVDRFLLKLTRGRFSLAIGKPVALLHTIGRKSGLPRTTPVMVARDEDRFILIASNFGSQTHPAWYLNLEANPEVKLTVGGQSQEYIARTAEANERADLWDKALENYTGFNVYRERVNQREIPVVVLEPVSSE